MKDLRLRENKQLTEQQLTFIEHYFQTGHKRNSAKAAGYKHPDKSAWDLLQNELVLEHLIELIRKNQKAEALVGHKALLELATDSPPAVRLKAATELLNRSGLMVVQQHEHKHTVEDLRSDEEIKAQIQAIADELNIKTVDGEVIEDAKLVEAIGSEKYDQLPEWLR